MCPEPSYPHKQQATGIKDRTSIMLIFNDVDCTKG